MKPYFIKVGYFLIFIFAILNFLGLKQTEFEIRQLDSTARILTTHAEAIQAAQEQPTLNAAAAAALTRADTQIAIASFSNENVAGEAKRLASLCNANIKEKSITASVSNDAVLEEVPFGVPECCDRLCTYSSSLHLRDAAEEPVYQGNARYALCTVPEKRRLETRKCYRI